MSELLDKRSNQEPTHKEILYSEDEVIARIDEMAADIIERYKNTDPLFVCILHGAIPFTNGLMMSIARQDPSFTPNLKTMVVSHYGPNREPGQMRVVTPLPHEDEAALPGKTAIILDDLIDRGDTIDFTKQYLEDHGAAKVEAIVLVKKMVDPPTETEIAMYGFEAPDEWLIGMGMDDSSVRPEANRWAGWIAIANS